MGIREETLQRIDTSRSEIDRLVMSLSPGDFAKPAGPDWTIKDLVAHITAWEKSLLALLEGADRAGSMGLPAGSLGSLGEDELNHMLLERSRRQELDATLDEYRAAYSRLMAQLESMDDDAFSLPYSHFQPDDPPYNETPVAAWIADNTWQHYEEHLPALRAAVAD